MTPWPWDPMQLLYNFVFFYPLFMAMFWVVGAVVFYWRRERGHREPPQLERYPLVSILVPCHDEELAIADTIRQLARTRYPRWEILAVDDCSTDGTREILLGLAAEIPQLRVLALQTNLGKAKALTLAALAGNGEYLMCIDADALLDVDAIHWAVADLEHSPRAGAVTGNPRVLNRTNLLALVQVGEFSAIVGMIKRAQRLVGRVYTVSGVCACFRRRALHEVGYWSSNTVTDDVDVSWKLQLAYWGILFEPRALCWILVPETFAGLWRQRLRWARGGFEAAMRYTRRMFDWHKRRMWPVLIELGVSTVWCYAMAFTLALWLGTLAFGELWPEPLRLASLLPGWTGTLLAMSCLVQFATGILLDTHYEGRRLLRALFWAIWYPAIYWAVSAAASVVALPIAVRHFGRTKYAVWKSPDR